MEPIEMQNQVMGYDRTAAMFSPDGHLLQVEYAEKTIRLGSASIGMVCTNGVLIVADKRIRDKLVMGDSANKIYEVDDNIAASAAGILSDARVLIERAQIVAQQHRITYGSEIDVESIIKEVANTKQLATQYGGIRPFGVAILLAGMDKKPRVFVSDVTGNYFSYKATAIGESDERIKEILRQQYNDNINVEQGIKLALKIFKGLLGKNFDTQRFDVGYIDHNKKLKRISGDILKKYIK